LTKYRKYNMIDNHRMIRGTHDSNGDKQTTPSPVAEDLTSRKVVMKRSITRPIANVNTTRPMSSTPTTVL
jgi:hypothetical protein